MAGQVYPPLLAARQVPAAYSGERGPAHTRDIAGNAPLFVTAPADARAPGFGTVGDPAQQPEGSLGLDLTGRRSVASCI